MIVYLVRHAEAEEQRKRLPDEWRCLTAEGRRVAGRISKEIAALDRKPRRIITSPLTRAVQTAELIAANACRKHSVETNLLLMPGGNIPELIAFLQTLDEKRVMLVGHEPLLGTLAAALLGGNIAIEMKKGSCIALKPGKDGGPGEFIWYLVPGKKVMSSLKKAFRRK